MKIEALRAEIERRIHDGIVPKAPMAAASTLASSGNGGSVCAGCGKVIPRDQVQYEVALAGGAGQLMTLLMHPHCHAVWTHTSAK